MVTTTKSATFSHTSRSQINNLLAAKPQNPIKPQTPDVTNSKTPPSTAKPKTPDVIGPEKSLITTMANNGRTTLATYMQRIRNAVGNDNFHEKTGEAHALNDISASLVIIQELENALLDNEEMPKKDSRIYGSRYRDKFNSLYKELHQLKDQEHDLYYLEFLYGRILRGCTIIEQQQQEIEQLTHWIKIIDLDQRSKNNKATLTELECKQLEKYQAILKTYTNDALQTSLSNSQTELAQLKKNATATPWQEKLPQLQAIRDEIRQAYPIFHHNIRQELDTDEYYQDFSMAIKQAKKHLWDYIKNFLDFCQQSNNFDIAKFTENEFKRNSYYIPNFENINFTCPDTLDPDIFQTRKAVFEIAQSALTSVQNILLDVDTQDKEGEAVTSALITLHNTMQWAGTGIIAAHFMLEHKMLALPDIAANGNKKELQYMNHQRELVLGKANLFSSITTAKTQEEPSLAFRAFTAMADVLSLDTKASSFLRFFGAKQLSRNQCYATLVTKQLELLKNTLQSKEGAEINEILQDSHGLFALLSKNLITNKSLLEKAFDLKTKTLLEGISNADRYIQELVDKWSEKHKRLQQIKPIPENELEINKRLQEQMKATLK